MKKNGMKTQAVNILIFDVLTNINAPVPYVTLTSPESQQNCPNREACWSPMIEFIGI